MLYVMVEFLCVMMMYNTKVENILTNEENVLLKLKHKMKWHYEQK